MISLCQDVTNEPIQIQEIATFLSKLDTTEAAQTKFAEYKTLVETNQVGECFNKLASELDLLFSHADDSKIVSFFALFASLLIKRESIGKDLLPKVVSNIASSHTHKEVRLQILGDIFNLDSSPPRRFHHLHTIFQYAVETDQLESIQHHINNIDDWTYDLKLDAKQVRKLLAAILPGLKNSPESRDIFIRFLQSFETSEVLGEEFSEITERSLMNFMKDSTTTFETSELDELVHDCPVLGVSLKGRPVLELLEIFVAGNLRQFEAFAAKNEKFLSESGLSRETATEVISYSLLSRLFSTSRNVTYAEVAKELEVTEDDVELIVINAVTSGLVDARLNQPEKTISVRHAPHRNYTEKEWRNLGQRVDVFKDNILELVKELEGNVGPK